MEFKLGRTDKLRMSEQEEEQLEVPEHPPFVPSCPSPSSSSTGFGWHNGSSGGGSSAVGSFVEREHMFDKVVTPSDVGKLNRLVIPKQHAEKYFPLDTLADERGRLLCFEDRTGKPWHFRYSYWNSSQSYVITRGWSRFVKEKGLDAGDIVSFCRGVGEAGRHRLYIDWQRRPPSRDPHLIPLPELSYTRLFALPVASMGTTGGQLMYYRWPAASPPQMEVRQVGSGRVPMVLRSVPLVRDQAAVKRVRLFGVNLNCPESRDEASHHHSDTLSVSLPQLHPRTAFPLLKPPHASGDTPADSSSSSICKEKNTPLNFYL
ncbi:hypothetical protein OPV22_004202 [Ensete ventricosum]|uniref:TF-B3 domain-containing protein n=2 Tax=Ensete ventricosum TaxID=4639 RepID=A0AAV8S2R0_ENSVE|nr:hypothetical protein OPV22_004202 [Ensete ventricosum]